MGRGGVRKNLRGATLRILTRQASMVNEI